VSAALDIDVVNGPNVIANTLYTRGKVSVGGEVHVNTHLEDSESMEVVDASIGIGYKETGWEATVRTTKSFNSIRGTYLQPLSPYTELAASVDFALNENNQKITVAMRNHIDKFSFMKAKMDSSSVLTCCYVHGISEALQVSVAMSADAKDWGPGKQKIGIGISYDA
jgi:hypothetical protein